MRLSGRQAAIEPKDLEFVSGLINLIDPDWIEFLRVTAKEQEADESAYRGGSTIADCLAILKGVGLDTPSSTERILSLADASIEQTYVGFEDRKRIAHIYAATETSVPPDYTYFVQDQSLVLARNGVLIDPDGILEEVLPEATLQTTLIHESYSQASESCSTSQWQAWSLSSKSRLATLPPFQNKNADFQTKQGLEEFLTSRNTSNPTEYQYKGRASYRLRDKIFPSSLVSHFDEMLTDDPVAWASFIALLLKGDPSQWSPSLTSPVYEVSANGNDRRAKCAPVPCEWTEQLSQRACLLDTMNRPCVPGDLLVRTPQTEPLMGVEPFVKADFDTPKNRPLLEAIGCRLTPAGPEKLLGRIKALSQMEQPPIHELAKWYEAIDKVVARSSASEIVTLQEEFKQHSLIYTQSNEWAKVDEVFRFIDQDGIPDSPTIHPAISELMMWPRIGVADRPSPELVIEWLKTLPKEKRIDAKTRRRVKGCLQTFPDKIWNECGHWLSLDDRWLPIDDFKFRSTRDRTFRTSDLFPNVQAKTADLRNLNESDRSNPYFAALPDIGQHLELRLTKKISSVARDSSRTWFKKLGSCLSRVAIPDDDMKEKTIRSEAIRLSESVWRSMKSLQVTPYLDGEPAGQPFDADVVWNDQDLFVKDQSLVAVYKNLVDELSRPFGSQLVTDAIRACADRSDQFIEEYVNHHFDIAEVAAPKPEIEQSKTTAQAAMEHPSGQLSSGKMPNAPNSGSLRNDSKPEAETADTSADRLSDRSGTSLDTPDNNQPPINSGAQRQSDETGLRADDAQVREKINSTPSADFEIEDEFQELVPGKPAAAPAPKKPAKAPLIGRFAEAKGFKWIVENQLAKNSSGEQLKRSAGLFRWQISRAEGTVVSRLWLAPQSLTVGVELPAEIWNVLKQSPSDCTFVFEDNRGSPLSLSGEQILQEFETGNIKLFPATYRIRQIGELVIAET